MAKTLRRGYESGEWESVPVPWDGCSAGESEKPPLGSLYLLTTIFFNIIFFRRSSVSSAVKRQFHRRTTRADITDGHHG